MLKPSDFNDYANISLFNIFQEIKDNAADSTTSIVKGKADHRSKIHEEDALNDLFKTDTLSLSSGKYPKPTDFDFIDGLYINDIRISEVDLKTQKLLSTISYMNPTDDTPVYVEYEDGYEVISEDITGDVTIYYNRLPSTPMWTYVVVGDNIIFDGASSSLQNMELPQYYFNQIVIDILFFAGVNIRDEQMLKALLAKESTDDLTDYRKKTLTR